MKNKNFVFDTNCLVSALLTPLSTNRSAINKTRNKGKLIYSIDTLAELNAVLIRSKFDKYISVIERLAFVKVFETEGLEIKIKSDFDVCRDPKDNKFLNLAYDGNAYCIVSGDNDLLSLHPFESIPIISPADFLKIGL